MISMVKKFLLHLRKKEISYMTNGKVTIVHVIARLVKKT